MLRYERKKRKGDKAREREKYIEIGKECERE